MNGQDVIERLRAAVTPQALQALGQELNSEILDGPRAVVQSWVTGDEPTADKASFVVLEMGNAATGALLAEGEGATVAWRFRLVRMAVENHWRLRTQGLEGLEPQLTNRTALRASLLPAPQEPGTASRRICDESYILIRTLLADEAAAGPDAFTPAAFLKQPEEARDAEIRAWTQSESWKTLHEEP
ncbi:MAG TPA: hypothetical protein VGM03_13390 [Phycisphaerae bacterium]|jgi:hypothetical protein